MTMLLAGVLLLVLVVVGMYVVGWFNTPYLDAFRFAFYLLLILFVITVAFAFLERPYEGYDPTARVP